MISKTSAGYHLSFYSKPHNVIVFILCVFLFAMPVVCKAQCSTCGSTSFPLKVSAGFSYCDYDGRGDGTPLTLTFCNQSAAWTPDPYGRFSSGHWMTTIPINLNQPYLVQDNFESVWDMITDPDPDIGGFTGCELNFEAPSNVDVYFDDVKLIPAGAYNCTSYYESEWVQPCYNEDAAGNLTLVTFPPYGVLFGVGDITGSPHTLVAVSSSVTPFGSCDPQLHSVHLDLGLGSMPNGASAGSITLNQNSLTADSYKVSSLSCYPIPGVEVIRPTGTNRQINASQGLADIVPLQNSASGYEIRFYAPSQIGSKDATGLYTPTGTPLVTWRVENPDASSNTYTRFDLTQIIGTAVTKSEYKYNAGSGVWSLSKGGDAAGNFTRTETRTVATGSTTETNPDGSSVSQSVVTETVTQYGSTIPVSSVSHYYNHYAWGDGEVRTEVGLNNDVQVTTRVFSSTGVLIQTTNPDGSYDLSGRGPFMDSPGSVTAAQSQANAGWYHSTDGTFESINGQTVRQSYEVSSTTASNVTNPPTSDSIDVLVNAVSTDAENALVTTAGTYSAQCASPWASQRAYTQYPDGRQDTWTYEPGIFLTSSDGVFHYNLSGNALRTTVTHGTVASPVGVAGYSTRERSTYDEQGHLLIEELFALPQGSTTYTLLLTTAHTYDALGNLTGTVRSGRTIYSATWANGRKTSETDENGVVTSYGNFDGSGNALLVTQGGVNANGPYVAQSPIPTSLAYDAVGKILSLTRGTVGLQQAQSSAYNTAGLLTSQTTGGLTTTYTYTNGGRTMTATLPGGATQITDHYLDGRDKSIGGTGVEAKAYVYGLVTMDDSSTGDKAGYQWKIEYEGTSDPASPTLRYTKTVTDWMGRTTRTEKPAFGGGTFDTKYFYDSMTGLLTKMTQTGLADTLYAYDPLGVQRTVGLDMDGSGSLEANSSTDQFTDTNVVYQQVGSNMCSVATITAHADTPAVTTQTGQITGLTGNTVSQITTSGPTGTTTETITIDRANKLTTTTTSVPGATNPAVQVVYNGLIVSDRTPTAPTAAIYTSDALGRLSTTTVPGTGAIITTTYDAATGQVGSTSTVSADQNLSTSTVYAYYGLGDTGSGQVPGQLKNKTVNGLTSAYTYNSRNQLAGVTGNTYPLSYGYDIYGALQTLTTTGAAGNSVTTWVHDPATGLVKQKLDNSQVGPSYTYYPYGKVQTRTWTRGIVTSYSYDGNGGLAGMSYSDGMTPTVTITNNRLGRPVSVTDAAGTHAISYTKVGQVAGDNVSGSGVLTGTSVSVGYNSYSRRNALTASGSSLTYSAGYSYDAASGNLSGITDNTNNGAVGYGFQSNSTQVASTTFNHGGAVRLASTRTPDGLGRLSSITNSASGSIISSHAYTYNFYGQRSQATLADGSYWLYGYSTRGDVASGHHYWTSGATPVAGQQFDYSFDATGNRTSTTVNGRSATYTPNALNQYNKRDVPSTVDVLGLADPAATVTINNLPPDTRQQGGYFYKELGVANTSGAVDQSVDVLAFKGGAGTGGADVISDTQGYAFVPQTPERFSYDTDGNLTQDGRWMYTWNGENRLIQMTSLSPSALYSSVIISFAYDWQGRRISRTVAAQGFSPNSSISTTTKFLYDGWNLIAELGAGGTAIRTYLWGYDLSGSLRGAGGVGGLLAINDYTSNSGVQTHYACCDGNGNVKSLVNAVDGSLSAQYEYGPFGELLRATGSDIAKSNPFKFSSKYTDEIGGLVYYGFRLYNPDTGRWINRDPLGDIAFYARYADPIDQNKLASFEREAVTSTYVFIGNSVLANVDTLGLKILNSIYVAFNQSSPSPGDASMGGGIIDKASGRLFQGLMYTYSAVQSSDYYNVKSGGNVDSHSCICKNPGYQPGDDTAIPSGNFTVDTKISQGNIGFSVHGTSPRSGIEIHMNGVTTGCIAMIDGWEEFKADMACTNAAGIESIPLSVVYRMSDGSSPPFGNRGNRTPDPGNPNPRIGPPPDTEGPPTPRYGEP